MIEIDLGQRGGNFLIYVGKFISSAAICVASSNVIVLIPILALIRQCVRIQMKYQKYNSIVLDLSKRTQSKVINQQIEMMNGLTQIKISKQQQYFLDKIAENIDSSQYYDLVQTGQEKWITHQVNFYSLAIKALSLFIAVRPFYPKLVFRCPPLTP